MHPTGAAPGGVATPMAPPTTRTRNPTSPKATAARLRCPRALRRPSPADTPADFFVQLTSKAGGNLPGLAEQFWRRCRLRRLRPCPPVSSWGLHPRASRQRGQSHGRCQTKLLPAPQGSFATTAAAGAGSSRWHRYSKWRPPPRSHSDYTHHVACAAPKGGPVSPALSAKLSTDPSGHYSCCRDRELTCLFCAEQVQEVQSWRRRTKQRLIAIHPVALQPAMSNSLLKAEVVR